MQNEDDYGEKVSEKVNEVTGCPNKFFFDRYWINNWYPEHETHETSIKRPHVD